MSSELRKQGVFVSAGGVRSIWLRHNLANFKQYLNALEKAVAEKGIILHESQVQTLERKKDDELGNVRVDEVLKTYSNGVYEAKISVFDPNTGKYIAKTNNKGASTMFPQNWTADRIKVEVQHAYTNKRPHSDPVKAERGMWEGTTYSGVKVEGYREVTVYPVKGQ